MLPVTVACGDDESSPADVADAADGDISDDVDRVVFASPFCESLPDGAPLSPGRWASRQSSAAIVNLPPTNTPTTVVTTRLILHSVELVNGAPRITHETCSLRQPKLNGVEVIFGPAFLSAVPRNSVIAMVDGASVVIPADRVVLGAEVEGDDPLPTALDDPRIRDSDDDGKPGVSVTLQGLFAGQLYVVYRQAIGLTGLADPAGCASGLLNGSSEQVQLGAFPSELEAIDLAPRPHPDPTLSTFQLVPLTSLADVSTFACGDLLAREVELFGVLAD